LCSLSILTSSGGGLEKRLRLNGRHSPSVGAAKTGFGNFFWALGTDVFIPSLGGSPSPTTRARNCRRSKKRQKASIGRMGLQQELPASESVKSADPDLSYHRIIEPRGFTHQTHSEGSSLLPIRRGLPLTSRPETGPANEPHRTLPHFVHGGALRGSPDRMRGCDLSLIDVLERLARPEPSVAAIDASSAHIQGHAAFSPARQTSPGRGTQHLQSVLIPTAQINVPTKWLGFFPVLHGCCVSVRTTSHFFACSSYHCNLGGD
jgi:hypothetical protein